MNIAREEFEKKVWAKHPTRYCFWAYVKPYIKPIVGYMTDINASYHTMTHAQLLKISTHVWEEDGTAPGYGKVIKDEDGTFSSAVTRQLVTSSGPITIKLPSVGPYHYTIVNAGGGGSGGSGGSGGNGGQFTPEILVYFGNTESDNSVAKCECGAHSVGSNRHSNWCDLSTLEGN